MGCKTSLDLGVGKTHFPILGISISFFEQVLENHKKEFETFALALGRYVDVQLKRLNVFVRRQHASFQCLYPKYATRSVVQESPSEKTKAKKCQEELNHAIPLKSRSDWNTIPNL